MKKKTKVKRKYVRKVIDQRPYLSLLAQDGLPLKLYLDSEQEFDVMSGGQSHHICIKYTLVNKEKSK